MRMVPSLLLPGFAAVVARGSGRGVCRRWRWVSSASSTGDAAGVPFWVGWMSAQAASCARSGAVMGGGGQGISGDDDQRSPGCQAGPTICSPVKVSGQGVNTLQSIGVLLGGLRYGDARSTVRGDGPVRSVWCHRPVVQAGRRPVGLLREHRRSGVDALGRRGSAHRRTQLNGLSLHPCAGAGWATVSGDFRRVSD